MRHDYRHHRAAQAVQLLELKGPADRQTDENAPTVSVDEIAPRLVAQSRHVPINDAVKSCWSQDFNLDYQRVTTIRRDHAQH